MIATQHDIGEHGYELAVLDEFEDGDYSNYDIHVMVARFIRTFVPNGLKPEMGDPHNHPNAIE